MTQSDSRHQTADGVQLDYRLKGTGPVVLFLHGLGANLDQFAPQEDYFAPDYRVLRVSLRGHGNSTAASTATAEAYTMPTLLVDVIGLLDALEIEKVHFVGNSMGGLVGYECLQHNPERMHSLTTFGTVAELHRGGLTSSFMTGLMRLIGPVGMGWMTDRTASRDREVAEKVGAMMRDVHRDALRFCTVNIADYDYRQVLRTHPDVPILLLQGEYDRDINQELGSTYDALNRHGNSTILDLPRCGHFANLEKPERFNRVLRDFIEQITEPDKK